jgi:hypothetical protein
MHRQSVLQSLRHKSRWETLKNITRDHSACSLLRLLVRSSNTVDYQFLFNYKIAFSDSLLLKYYEYQFKIILTRRLFNLQRGNYFAGLRCVCK